MKKLILGLSFSFLMGLNYSCVSIAEGNSIKKDIAKMDAKYKLLENRLREDQNEFKRKLRRVDAKLLEMDKILKEAKKLLHRNNADFGQEMVQMDIRVKKVEGKNEEILFKFEQLEKKFNELKERISEVNTNISIRTAQADDNKTSKENEKVDKTDSKEANTEDYKKINNPIALYKLGYSYIDGKKYKSMSHREKMDKAIEIFEYLIKKYPNHNKSNSARYWITQAYYSSGQYEKAYKVMNKFLEKYPKSRHIPQILFQMAYSLKKLDLKKESKSIFKTLIKLYPKSYFAKKAKEVLKTL